MQKQDGTIPQWLTELDTTDKWAGLLEFGTIEETGFFSMAGYDFEFEEHALAFTDLYSADCEAPVMVFFDEEEQEVARTSLENLSVARIVAELAAHGIKARVRQDAVRSATGASSSGGDKRRKSGRRKAEL